MTPANTSLFTGDITTELPAVVSNDPSFQASIKNFTDALQSFLSNLNTLLIKPNYVNLSSDLINELAIEFRPPGYDQSWPLYQRIQAISTACYDNAHLGTLASVQRLVNIAFGQAVVQEWWQYGGRPYRFRILTTDPAIDPKRITILNNAILETKPLSRWLDSIVRIGGGNGQTYVGASMFTVRTRRFPDTHVDTVIGSTQTFTRWQALLTSEENLHLTPIQMQAWIADNPPFPD